MNLFKRMLTVCALFFTVSSVAVVGVNEGFISAENVISQDKAVVRVQRDLQRQHFKPFRTVTKPTYYIVAPTERRYQTSEAVITMVDNSKAENVQYVDVRVAIIYDSETETYSAGEVSVKLLTNRARL